MPRGGNRQFGGVNPFLISTVVLLLIVIVGAVYILIFSRATKERKNRDVRDTVLREEGEASRGVVPPVNDDAVGGEKRFDGESFSIAVPEGWLIANQIPGTLVTMMYTTETHDDDPAAQRVNFKSYIAVLFDESGGRSFDEIVSTTIDAVTRTVPSSAVLSTNDGSISAAQARFVELSVRQQEVDYRVLLVVLFDGDRYYVVSANTTAKKWPEYRDLFHETAQSFVLK